MAGKKFRFRLQRLLDVRRLREKQEIANLQAAHAAHARELAALEKLQQEERDLLERMSWKPGKPFDPEDRMLCQRWLRVVEQQQDTQRDQVSRAWDAVLRQEEVLRQARIDVKALEKLYEKQKDAFRAEQLHEEQVFLDDVAGQQFSRNLVEEAHAQTALDGGDAS